VACGQNSTLRNHSAYSRFPARKTLDDFDFDAQPAIRAQVGSLASGGFLTEARNIVLLGVAAARHGHRVLFATATDWISRLSDAHRSGRGLGECSSSATATKLPKETHVELRCTSLCRRLHLRGVADRRGEPPGRPSGEATTQQSVTGIRDRFWGLRARGMVACPTS
jgi:IstB-like ATP binding protein